jgi:hypothetical protein
MSSSAWKSEFLNWNTRPARSVDRIHFAGQRLKAITARRRHRPARAVTRRLPVCSRKASRWLNDNEPEKALACFDQALALDPKHAEALD